MSVASRNGQFVTWRVGAAGWFTSVAAALAVVAYVFGLHITRPHAGAMTHDQFERFIATENQRSEDLAEDLERVTEVLRTLVDKLQ